MKISRIALSVPLLNDTAKAYSATDAEMAEDVFGVRIVTRARPGFPTRYLLAPWPIVRGVEYERPAEPAAVVEPPAPAPRAAPKGAGSKMRR